MDLNINFEENILDRTHIKLNKLHSEQQSYVKQVRNLFIEFSIWQIL